MEFNKIDTYIFLTEEPEILLEAYHILGIYDPAHYYGKLDMPFSQVKLGELGSWFGRRNKTPQALVGAISRAMWRWEHKYIHSRRGGIAPFYQMAVGLIIFAYVLNYPRIKNHKNYRFH